MKDLCAQYLSGNYLEFFFYSGANYHFELVPQAKANTITPLLRKPVHLRTFKQPLAQEKLKENESSNDESIESAKDQLRKITNSFDNSEKQLVHEIYSPSVTTLLNEDERQPENLSNTSLRQDDFAHSTPFTATVVNETIRHKSTFLTQEHSFLKDNFNLRSKLNFSG
jgi:hypothetical protein